MSNGITVNSAENIERLAPDEIKLGQWYWVECNTKKIKHLCCVLKIGSNFIELEGLVDGNRYISSFRIHVEEMHKRMTCEPDAMSFIDRYSTASKVKTRQLLAEVEELTRRLSFDGQPGISDSSGTDLAVLSENKSVSTYKTDLISAKEIELPALFDAIKKENENIALWMKVETLPMTMTRDSLNEKIKAIDEKVFNVELYAGITEDYEQIKEGEAAPMGTKLHVMQRKIFLDEECLLNYEEGGIDIEGLEDLDRWISKPENMNRLLPFDRTMIVAQVRRNEKERDNSTFENIQCNIRLSRLDKNSYLFIRNGEKLYRIDSEVEFDHLVFPDGSLDLNQPMMFELFANKVRGLITVSDYEERVKISEKAEKNYADYLKRKEIDPDTPYQHINSSHDLHNFHKMDSSSLYYDEAQEYLSDKIKRFNRIALVMQGLFDRSEMLHPHAKVKTWEAESFAKSVTLISDYSNALYAGEEPDVKAYINKCNESMGKGSYTVGQVDFWLRAEAEKENNRPGRPYRDHSLERYSPEGNPGPNYVSKILRWQPKVRKAGFTWYREAKNWSNPDIKTSIAIPADKLFNVSAYKIGDYKQFFADPRTREKYLQWAPMLIAAEDFHLKQRRKKSEEMDDIEEG